MSECPYCLRLSDSQCVDGPRLVFPFVCGWTPGSSQRLAVVSNAAVNVGQQVVLQALPSLLCGHPSSGLAGPRGKSVVHFLKNCVLSSTRLHHVTLPRAVHRAVRTPPALVSALVYMVTVLMGVRWHTVWQPPGQRCKGSTGTPAPPAGGPHVGSLRAWQTVRCL